MTWTISALSTTPVKGMTVHRTDQLDLSLDGVVGDRAFFLIEDDGDLVSCTDLGGLLAHRAEYVPDTQLLSVHGPAGLVHEASVELGEPVVTDFYGLREVPGRLVEGWHEPLTELAGRSVRLVRAEAGAYDVAGVTLLGTASVAALSGPTGPAVDPRRFRMNVEVFGTEPYAEDGWDGHELQLGEVRVRVGGPVKRCAATTRDPDSGTVDLQTLRMIAARRGRQRTPEWGVGSYLGVYAEVVVPGRLRTGERVRLL
jgi:uncharacterized protein YcbX